ncbi:MAG: hypothetical protein DA328_03850 [Nitrososphaeraceae archaeon]|nr:hypothetical protein [Nitrososphaeraceae archaeon]
MLTLIYVDTSVFDYMDLFEFSTSNKILDIVFVISVAVFIYINTIIVYKLEHIIQDSPIPKTSFKRINKIITIYNILLFVPLIIISYQIIFEKSYYIHFIYLILLISHIFGLFFSIAGLLKFLRWSKQSKEKLAITYLISFALFSILIIFSLLYHISEISKHPTNITLINYHKETQTKSLNIPEIYKFYISTYILTFFAIWVSTFFLMYQHVSKNPVKLFVTMLIPMILFLINLLPNTTILIVNLISMYPFLFPLYTITSTLSFFIGPVIFSSVIFILITNTKNKTFKNYLLPLSYGLFLILVSTQPSVFSKVLYPPFGLISLLFSGLSVYMIFIGFYLPSVSIKNNYLMFRTLIGKYQFELFKNMARVEYENEVKKIFDKIQKGDEFKLSQKKNIDQLDKEEISRLVEYVKRELKIKDNTGKGKDNTGNKRYT